VIVPTVTTRIPDERAARIAHATMEYRQHDVATALNQSLRDSGFAGLSDDQREVYIGLSDAISYNRLTGDTTLYRGFQGSVSEWEGLEGTRVTLGDGGFVSTTASSDVAWLYASGQGSGNGDGYILQIDAAKGSRAFSYSGGNNRDPESEVVLSPKRQAEVISVDSEAGIVHLKLR
jgi:uncharacterized protein YfaQ (DUF2300 family)